MKILKLQFKNLNSLYGQWSIDFTDPAYQEGIFALIGPTGAGKTTILDAICLALYAQTPRLGKITKTSNELMARGSGECFAEVLFSSASGTFRVQFTQHRARKRSQGELQMPVHEIATADGEIIESKVSRVPSVVAEKTGMNFERFTRSVLLAQGGFDSFLKANAEQKSRLLEQITGTEIYSAISQRVFERKKEEQAKLELLLAQSRQFMPLSEEEEEQLQRQVAQLQQEQQQLELASKKAEQAIRWKEEEKQLIDELDHLEQELKDWQQQVKHFAPERKKLELGNRIAEIEGVYVTFAALDKEQHADKVVAEELSEQIPALQDKLQEQQHKELSAEEQLAKAQAQLQEGIKLVAQMRSLDEKIAEKKVALQQLQQQSERQQHKVKQQQKLWQKEQEQAQQLQQQLHQVEDYLAQHHMDEWLVGGLAQLEQELTYWGQQQQQLERQKTLLAQKEQKRVALVKQLKQQRQKLQQEQTRLTSKQQQQKQWEQELTKLLAGKQLREYRFEQEALWKEQAYVQRIEQLESQRIHLEDGHPCPLCGATKHPFVQEAIVLPDDLGVRLERLGALIKHLEQLEQQMQELKLEQLGIQQRVAQQGQMVEQLEQELKRISEEDKELRSQVALLAESTDAAQKTILAQLAQLDIGQIGKVEELLPNLQQRRTQWQHKNEQQAELAKECLIIGNELNKQEMDLAHQRNLATSLAQQVSLAMAQLAELEQQRQTQFGHKQAEQEEFRWQELVNKRQQEREEIGRVVKQLSEELVAQKTALNSVQERIKRRVSELAQAQEVFAHSLAQIGMHSEEEMLAAKLTSEQRQALSEQAKWLEQRGVTLEAKSKDRQERLSTLRQMQLSKERLSELVTQQDVIQAQLKEIQEEAIKLQQQLIKNSELKNSAAKQQLLIDQQTSLLQRWEKLNHLIGSADGKKFRTFAQGLTFELLISYTNRQLIKMSDRYQLLCQHSERAPLELAVIDNYQASQVRSIRNLSGGERFLVSLALALGLSQMASAQVRVDSLFLDEGFGTLDEEKLDTALAALATIHQEGKLIGIISHVPALKERIGVQIKVTPYTDGKSKIVGPGVNNS